jgi:hypothetical protein
MQSIQEIASAFADTKYKIMRGSLYHDITQCSEKLRRVIGLFNDRYQRDFLETALDAIEKHSDEINKPEDIKSVTLNWDNFRDYWEYYIANPANYYRLERIIRDNLDPAEITKFSQERFMNMLVQEEMDEVFQTTLEYLFEVYNAQEDIDVDDEEYADSDEEA